MVKVISVVSSMDSEPQPESTKLMSLVTQAISVFKSMDLDSQPEPLSKLITMFTKKLSMDSDCDDSEFLSLYYETFKLDPRPELISIIPKIVSLFTTTTDPEQIISLVSSLDLDSQPKPQTEIMSVLTQTVSVANSVSESEPEWECISLMTRFIALIRSSDPEQMPPAQLFVLLNNVASHIYSMDEDSELGSLIGQLFEFSDPSDLEPPEEEWELDHLISLSPQLKVELVQGKFHVTGKVQRKSQEKGQCLPGNRQRVYLAARVGGEEATHFLCKDCNGEDHEECEKTLVEVTHHLHPKHSLQLVSQKKKKSSSRIQPRKCFCCDEDLDKIFYYCEACDYAMNIACTNKPPVLSIDHPKWHEHTLSLFPRRAFLTCNLCALSDASSPIYMCPPCDFVVHLRCMKLPRVIRISRHPHRISFTPSFSDNQGDWSCGVCRKHIDNDYGGYSCNKNDCSYAAHSRCATQSNVWDGIDLDGVPEDIEEEVEEPFLRISHGIIQHFSHQQHHLRLDDNTGGDYDDNKECQACVTPIYFGKFYSCVECDFILHEACANLSRKIHHPIHPHLLTLVGGCDGVPNFYDNCSACLWSCIAGFFYECGKEGCSFKLHVQCATVSEPLVQESHNHPLFLTSKPGEQSACSVCREARPEFTNETFNCIECEFSLCFGCATLPQKVRYKHDKHILTLSFGEETSTMMHWCEACERRINPKERFYKCDEYCCNTLHIECLIGKDLYMKSGSYFDLDGRKLAILRNNHMSRPTCFGCRKRCPYKIVVQNSLLIFCSISCL
ncbi:uncharacterized protein LOC18014405 isoform X2 [Eutrema salsugineum]|uniref:uncharacterized protein LOC18014405 isoform X2 n=1 Tax=Eutrema salsugineum TaxID=72664 RepID=UPI000CECF2FE|nr:uncharacterized protein LOC18014405 isoform X2 [Eutrema salsugineum]